jgi:hypothetical protein
MLGRRQLIQQEDISRTRTRDFKEQLCLGNGRTTSGIYRKTIGLEIMNRAVGISSELRRIRNWTLWSGWPPPKWKKKLQVQQGPVM